MVDAAVWISEGPTQLCLFDGLLNRFNAEGIDLPVMGPGWVGVTACHHLRNKMEVVSIDDDVDSACVLHPTLGSTAELTRPLLAWMSRWQTPLEWQCSTAPRSCLK